MPESSWLVLLIHICAIARFAGRQEVNTYFNIYSRHDLFWLIRRRRCFDQFLCHVCSDLENALVETALCVVEEECSAAADESFPGTVGRRAIRDRLLVFVQLHVDRQ